MSAEKLTLDAPAKINLLLDIICRLPNGYHSLFMVMQTVDLYDTVEVSLRNDGKINLTCSEKALPTDSKNIAYRAAVKFFEAAGINCGADISLTKRIPFAAGLAGGSTDAAAVLKALNTLCDTNFTDEELCAIGVKLGADVPFCIKGGTMLAQDIGQVLSPLPKLKDCFIVLVKPDVSVSTKEAFAEFDSCSDIRHPDCLAMLHAAANSDYDGIISNVGNVFEQFIEVPQRAEIKAIMRRHGSLACCMSGSGPTVFGIFDSEEKAKACIDDIPQKLGKTFLTKPI
ncbi:MAG: 4-(cytidine 5'-diphospho)-2-C-methyl-D-erythritol kinase [Clostridia bacterium]|nr:4-(cytidine 5'-diphospho)-2-C-methyl-D-erythritol kinase [Clostridia bacterium]